MKTRKTVLKDLNALGGPSSLRNLAWSFFKNPGFRTVFIYRIQQRCFANRQFRLSALISSLNHSLNGAEILSGCEIGERLIIRHPSGIVIGAKVVIGTDCIIQSGVTIGEKFIDSKSDGGYPVLGDRVSIASHAVVIGKISIGDDVTIGALTLVNRSCSSNKILVGVPFREINR